MTINSILDNSMEKVYARLEERAGPQVHNRSSVSGVWLPERARKPEHEGIHGRVCTVTWADATWFRTLAKLDGREAVVDAQWVFTAPDGAALGAALGDAYQPVLDAQREDGETDGTATGEGYSVDFGGACPVQGWGVVDGHACYYRARGKGWSLEVYPPGASADDLNASPLWEHGEACYIWPDGGYVRPELSQQNIARAVAKFRGRDAPTE